MLLQCCVEIGMTDYFLAGQVLVLISGGKCEEESVKSKCIGYRNA